MSCKLTRTLWVVAIIEGEAIKLALVGQSSTVLDTCLGGLHPLSNRAGHGGGPSGGQFGRAVRTVFLWCFDAAEVLGIAGLLIVQAIIRFRVAPVLAGPLSPSQRKAQSDRVRRNVSAYRPGRWLSGLLRGSGRRLSPTSSHP